MMDREEEILEAFDRYCAATGLSPATVGMYAHRDTNLYIRLKNKGSCTKKTGEKVMRWFKENMPQKIQKT